MLRDTTGVDRNPNDRGRSAFLACPRFYPLAHPVRSDETTTQYHTPERHYVVLLAGVYRQNARQGDQVPIRFDRSLNLSPVPSVALRSTLRRSDHVRQPRLRVRLVQSGSHMVILKQCVLDSVRDRIAPVRNHLLEKIEFLIRVSL